MNKLLCCLIMLCAVCFRVSATVNITLVNDSTSAVGSLTIVGCNTGQQIGFSGSLAAGAQTTISGVNNSAYNDTSYYAIGYCDFGSVATTGETCIGLSSSTTGNVTLYIYGGGCGGSGPLVITNYCWTIQNGSLEPQYYVIADCNGAPVVPTGSGGALTFGVLPGQTITVCSTNSTTCQNQLGLWTNGAPCTSDGNLGPEPPGTINIDGTGNGFINWCGGTNPQFSNQPQPNNTNPTNNQPQGGFPTNLFNAPTNASQFGTNVNGLGTGTNLELESTAEKQTQMEFQMDAATVAALNQVDWSLVLGFNMASNLLGNSLYIQRVQSNMQFYANLNMSPNGLYSGAAVSASPGLSLSSISSNMTNLIAAVTNGSGGASGATAALQSNQLAVLQGLQGGINTLSNSVNSQYSGSFAQVTGTQLGGISNNGVLGNGLLESLTNLAGRQLTNNIGLTNWPTNFPDAQVISNTSTNTSILFGAYLNGTVGESNAAAFGVGTNSAISGGASISNAFSGWGSGVSNALVLGAPDNSGFMFPLPSDGVSPANLVLSMAVLPTGVTSSASLVKAALTLWILILWYCAMIVQCEVALSSVLGQRQLQGSRQSVFGVNATIISWAAYANMAVTALIGMPVFFAAFVDVFSTGIGSWQTAISVLSSSPVWPMVTAFLPMDVILSSLASYIVFRFVVLPGYKIALRLIIFLMPS